MRLNILSMAFPLLLGAFASESPAQTSRACESYVSGVLVAEILGQPTAQNPGNGQYSKDQTLEGHSCDWISYYPPVAPGAPQNPATLSVSVQRYPSVEAMRKGQLTPQELGPKVKIERIARLGELGALYTNSERNTIVAVGSKGTKTVSVTVDMGLNTIRSGARKNLEATVAKLWNEL